MDACLPEPLPDWSRVATMAAELPHLPSGPQTGDYLEAIASAAVARAMGDRDGRPTPRVLSADYLLIWDGMWMAAPDWDTIHNHYGARLALYRRIKGARTSRWGDWEVLTHSTLPTFDAMRRHVECETGAIVEAIPCGVPPWCRGAAAAWQFVPRAQTYPHWE